MNTDLIDAGGFTPIIDKLVQKYGLVTAAVFGRVWRYCQGETGYCYASIERIAEELRLSRRTVLTHLKRLVADEFLYDHTPGMRNKPHSYSVTKKLFTPECFWSKSATTPKDTNGVNEIHTGVNEIHTGVKEIHGGYEIGAHEERSIKEIKKVVEERNSASALRASDAAAPPPTTSTSSFFTVKNYQEITIRKYYRMLKNDPLSNAVPGILAILGAWNIPAQNTAVALAYLEENGYNKEPV